MPPRADPLADDAPGGLAVSKETEQQLVERLRAGDTETFTSLVDRYHRLLLHLCRAYVSTPSVAEEIVQETWMAVVDGLGKFEGRSTLRSWICAIAINHARMRRRKDRRMVLLSVFDGDNAGESSTETETVADPRAALARTWDERTPEALLAGAQAGRALARAVDELPPAMRIVLVLRDIEGLSAAEVCQLLNITDANQRVLLHRARARLRDALAATTGD